MRAQNEYNKVLSLEVFVSYGFHHHISMQKGKIYLLDTDDIPYHIIPGAPILLLPHFCISEAVHISIISLIKVSVRLRKTYCQS